jgi:hypothetical protein
MRSTLGLPSSEARAFLSQNLWQDTGLFLPSQSATLGTFTVPGFDTLEYRGTMDAKALERMRESERRLFEIAQGQEGFFTAKQAKAAGFAESTRPYHVRVGNWIREHRGIYRLALFPIVEHPDLVKWGAVVEESQRGDRRMLTAAANG